MEKFLVRIAILAGLVISSMSVLSDETPALTSIQSATSGDSAGKFSGPGNDSPALQQSTGLDPAAATQAWLDSVPRDKREKSDAYFEGGYWLILWNYLVAAGISILLLSSRISARLRDFLERLTRYRTLRVACYSIAYLLLVYVLSFPLNVYEHFVREHQYGLATQSFPGSSSSCCTVCFGEHRKRGGSGEPAWPLFSRLFWSSSHRYSSSRSSIRINRLQSLKSASLFSQWRGRMRSR